MGSIQVSQSSSNDFYKKGSQLRTKCSIYLPQLFSQVQSGTVFQFFCYFHGIDTFDIIIDSCFVDYLLICICLKFPHESSQTVYFWQGFQKGVCVLIASYQVMHDFYIPTSNGTNFGHLIVSLHQGEVTLVPFVTECVVGRYFEAVQYLVPNLTFNLFIYTFISMRADSVLFYSVNYNPSSSLFWSWNCPWFKQ